MQDSDKISKKKKLMQEAIGRVIKRKRVAMGKGVNTFYFEYDLGNSIIMDTEKGRTEARIGTVWKFANAFGLKCSEFIKLVENELPEDFNFYDD